MTRRLRTTLPGLLTAALILVFPWTGAEAQFFEQKDVFDQSELDYEKIFKEGLSANGKTLNLSGKKIGDKGVEILLSKDFLKKVTKLDLRGNFLSNKTKNTLNKELAHLKSLKLF